MAKLVDAPDSGSGGEALAGSNPVIDTIFFVSKLVKNCLILSKICFGVANIEQVCAPKL